jgi:hypothetical protein
VSRTKVTADSIWGVSPKKLRSEIGRTGLINKFEYTRLLRHLNTSQCFVEFSVKVGPYLRILIDTSFWKNSFSVKNSPIKLKIEGVYNSKFARAQVLPKEIYSRRRIKLGCRFCFYR